MSIAAIHLSLGQVAATLSLVAVAALVSIWRHADLERDIGVATIRSLIQLTAIGYVIKLIFDQNSLIFVFALIAAMVLVGAITARHRARHVPNAFWPLVIARARRDDDAGAGGRARRVQGERALPRSVGGMVSATR